MKNIFKNTVVQIVTGLILIVIVTWGSIALLSRHDANYTIKTVERRNLTETVSANGKVISNQNAILAFNMQGRVASINVEVGSTTYAGQVLASLDNGTLRANLMGAEADALAAQARLTRIQNGARPEELALYSQKYTDATVALISAMKSAYLAMQDALVSKADTLFTNGNTVNPTINIQTQSESEKSSIQMERVALYDSLNKLKGTLATLNQPIGGTVATSSIQSARVMTSGQLSSVKSYLDHLSSITANLTPGGSGQSQTIIDSERSVVNAAALEVSNAMSSEQATDAAWSSARDALVLEQAGSAVEDIQATEAALEKARSAVLALQSQLRQSYIISPYDALVTSVNVKLGEVYVPGMSVQAGISIIGNGSFKAEVYVPETDVGKISVGNTVIVTFDAFGPNVPFAGHVSIVDPAETLQNGVNAYKVTVSFDDATDTRIKSGLTANVHIMTKSATSALAVPTRAIITRGNEKIVLVKGNNSSVYTEKPVSVGITSVDGYTEIVGGLEEGDEIAGFGLGK